jgi:DNA-directed RNA polymerase specialized sigma subunit
VSERSRAPGDAQKRTNMGLPLLDLVSECNIGLMKAVERFDPAKGGKLSTYAAENRLIDFWLRFLRLIATPSEPAMPKNPLFGD